MKYLDEHLRFEIAYAGRHITVSRDVCFDYDSDASRSCSKAQEAFEGRSQCILEFEKPASEIEALVRLLCASSDIRYQVTIGFLIGEMVFEWIEIAEKVRIGGAFSISQTFIR